MAKAKLRGGVLLLCLSASFANAASLGDFLHMVVPTPPPPLRHLLWKPPHLPLIAKALAEGLRKCMEFLHTLYTVTLPHSM
jgi:hypothetical protein